MRRSFRALAAVVTLSIAAVPGAFAQDTEIDLDPLRIPHERFVLDNGLTLLVHTDHSVPIVAVNVWYHVGSKDEKPGRTGFAHLFEHIFFNGSENHPHGFREAMDDLGANNRNGTTNTDRTNFFEDVPLPALERTLYLEADRLGFLAGHISEEMLERERGVVQNEKRQGENRPYGRVFDRVVETMYPASHPYSWSTIGRMEDLEAATLEDVKAWNAAYYNPNNVVLSLAGAIEPERALELVEKYFGAIPPGPPVTRYESWVPELAADVRDVMQDRVPQARIHRVWHAPPWGDEELVHLRLFASVLSGSKSAPLDRALVYDRELATEVSAFAWPREIASSFLLTATVQPDVATADAEEAMGAALAELLERGPSAEELDRAKTRFVSGFVKRVERLGGFGGRSDVLAESATYGDDPEAYLDQLRMVLEATPDEVRASARKWLGRHHYTLVVTPYRELAASEETIDRSILPALGEAPDVTFPEIQRARLDNGLEIVLLERHSVPLVQAALAIDAGYASDPAEGKGLASFAVGLLDDGTTTRDAFEIADALDALGASVFTDNGLDQSHVMLRALRANMEASFDLFADIARSPAFPEAMVELERKRRLAAIEQEKADPFSLALRMIPTLVYPDRHAYSAPLTGSGYPETVAALTRKDLVAWHASWFRPGSATLVVTGDVTMAELLPAVTSSFGGWQAGEAPAKSVVAIETANVGKVFLIDRPDAPQSMIAAAHVTGEGGRPEDLALETVMQSFGGMATSRLNRNLRLDKHWSYGAFGFVLDARGQRPFLVVAPVQTDKTKEAMLELRREIRDIAGERPIEGEELESILRNMVLRLPGRFETLSSLENAAVDLVNLGYPESYFSEYAETVRDLTAEDLDAAARAFVRPGELVWLVVGDLDRIEAGIRDLGFGEVVELDASP